MTIVNQYPVMETVLSPWILFVLTYFTCASLFIAILYFQKRLWGLGFFLAALALAYGGIFCYGLSAKVESGRNRYECLIDNTVPFVEVAENYDVVSRRGELWILEDRDEISVD